MIDRVGQALGVYSPHEVLLAAGDGKTRAWLYRSGAVLEENLLEDGRMRLVLQADQGLLGRIAATDCVELRALQTLPKIPSLQMETCNGVE